MFPGVARPFGVVKVGPDLYTGTDAYSGYLPAGVVTGYTMMHESGTGGAPKYGVVSQMPVVGNISNPLVDLSQPRAQNAQNDSAEVGYYKTLLASGVTTELAATEHAGILQHTFPKGQQSSVVIDVSHVLPSFRGLGLGQNYTGGNITLTADGHYEGSGTYNNGWNLGKKSISEEVMLYNAKWTYNSTRMDHLFLRLFRYHDNLCEDFPRSRQ